MLRKEVNRLQSMIDILLEQNAQLKEAIYQYQSDGNRVQAVRHVYADETDRAKQAFRYIPPEKDGVKQTFLHTTIEMDGAKQDHQPTPPQQDGVKQAFWQTILEQDGVKRVFWYTMPAMDGITKAINPIGNSSDAATKENSCQQEHGSAATTLSPTADQPGNMTHNPPASAAPNADDARKSNGNAHNSNKEVKPVNPVLLWNNLQTINPKSHERGLDNTVTILIALQQQPKQSLKDLQKLTGLSEDGITKRIMAMKKMGLIVRAPGRRLLLTAKSEKILNESRM